MSAASALASIERTRLLGRELGWQKLNQAISTLTSLVQENKKRQLTQELTKYYQQGQEVPPDAVSNLAARYRLPVADVLKIVEPINKMIKTKKYQLAGKMLLDIISKKKSFGPEDLAVVAQTTDIDPKTFATLIKTAGDVIDRYRLHQIVPPEVRSAFEKRVAPLPQGATWQDAALTKTVLGTKPQWKPTPPKKYVWYNRKTGESVVSPTSPGKDWVTESIYGKLISKTDKSGQPQFTEKELYNKFVSLAKEVAKDLPVDIPGFNDLPDEERQRILLNETIKRYKVIHPKLPLPSIIQQQAGAQSTSGDALSWIQNWMQRRQQPQQQPSPGQYPNPAPTP